MKLTKKLETEILKVYNTVWDAYLRGDMRTFASILDENCYIIGSAEGEVFSNKKTAVKYYKSTAEQITGKAEFRNRKIKVMPVEKGFMVNEEADFYLLIDDQWTFYGPGRISSLFHKKNNKWKVVHQHGSFPDSKTEEGEQVNTDKIKAENIQLRDAVKRRTEELENKNRELEIEAALERVRARAMAMQSSDELVEVANVMRQQMVELGQSGFDTAAVHLYSDDSEYFDSWYSFRQGDPVTGKIVTGKTKFKKDACKMLREMVKAYHSKQSDYTIKGSGEKLREWFSFLAKTIPEIKINLDKNPRSNYIHFSDFSGGSLVMATYEPPTKVSMLLQKRCAAVFDLAYRRYRDLKKAEAQSREAQIEAALERVRSRSMAMHHSNDLQDVIRVLSDQLLVLGLKFDTATFAKIHEDASWDLWISTPDQPYPAQVYVPYVDQPIFKDVNEAGKKKEKFFETTYTFEEKNIFFKYFFENTAAKNIPDERKQYVLNCKGMARSVFILENIRLSIANYEGILFTKDENAMMQRFANVFEQSYTRFLDLQKAEAQAKEARIELALERVRARAMAMHSSNELAELVSTVFNELTQLDFRLTSCIIWIHDHENAKNTLWIASAEMNNSAEPFLVNAFHNDFFRSINHAWRSKDTKWIYTFTGKEKKNFEKAFFKEIPHLPISLKNALEVPKQVVFSASFNNFGALEIVETEALTHEKFEILHRFGKVFDLSYTRFNDLKKAEAQAREAQIEAALERVRSRSMAMHKSDDLHEVIKVVTEQLSLLSVKFNVANFAKIDPDKSWNLWLSTPEQAYPALIHVPYIDHPIFGRITEEGTKRNDFFTDVYTREEANIFFHHFFENTIAKNTPEERKQFVYNSKGFARSIFLTKNIWFSVSRYDTTAFTDEENAIFKRFANVFEQAYTRFLDLQKAEAQARETEIELSLERVRAKAMAMQKPSEFVDVINIIGEQFVHLGFDIDWANFGANGLDISRGIDIWNFGVIPGASPISARVFIPYFDHPVFTTSAATINEFLNGGRDLITVTLDKQAKDTWLDHMFTKTIFKDVPGEYRVIQYAKPGYTTSNISLKDTWLSIGKFDIKNFTDEQHAILRKFANAFGQAYTRFLDLQKAEAQAREAQIEAGLERVRSRAMAMQTSEELNALIGTVFTELTKLDLVLTRCVIWILNKKTKSTKWWMANSEDANNPAGFYIKYHESHPYLSFLSEWEKQTVKWVYDLHGQVKKDWDDFLFSETELVNLPKFVQDGMRAPDRILLSATFNNFGAINVASLEPLSDEHYDILLRFAKVFDLTYTRFNDLKQAEAQTREAQIELALERVRARTMAMHKSEELAETAEVLYHQLKILGDSPERITIGILNEDNGIITWWATDQGGNQLNIRFEATIKEPTVMLRLYNNWKAKNKSLVIDLIGKELSDWVKYCREVIGVPIKEELLKNRRVQTASFFSHGWVMITSPELLDAESINVLERFASVFNLTYRRFLDLQKAEAQANEARIEIALERIRARALAMHKSDELMEVANVLREQMALLGQPELESSVVHLYEEDPDNILSWRSFRALDPHSKIAYGHMAIPKNCCDVVREWLTKFYSDLKEYTIEISGTKQEEWYEILFKLAPDVINSMRQENSIHEKRYYRFSKFSGGALLMVSKQEPSEEVTYLQKRAAVVFDLAYRRFSDLQKAEAQAKEAQIESALEKVRSRSLAMHKSDELQEVVNTVFERLQELNIEMASANIAIFKEGTRNYDYWIASPVQKRSASFYMPYMDISLTRDLIAARESGKEFSTTAYSFEEKNEWFEYAFKNTDFKFLSEERKQFILNAPAITVAIAFSKNTGVQVNRYNNKLYTQGEGEILKRFSKVFEQAYIRFLDLEKAEAQAREAQIETVLERVRSRTMAMQKSDELTDVAGLLFEQVSALGIKTWTAGFNVWSEDNNSYVDYITSPQGGFIEPYTVYTDTAEALTDISNARKSGVEFDIQYVEGEKIKQLYLALTKLDEKQYEIMLQDGVRFPSHQYEHFVFGSKVSLMFITYEPVLEAHDIFKRLGKVFEQTYTRFLDLQKAEAQARDAQIEASLERVRSKTMAMHNSQDVGDTVASMFDELVKLGVETVRCGIGIMYEPNQMEVWTAKKSENEKVELIIGRLDMTIHPLLQGMYNGWKNKDVTFSYELRDNDLVDYFTKLINSPDYHINYDITSLPQHQFHNDFYFSEGALFSFSAEQLSTEASQIFKRFAGVFEQTYRRYLDLLKAEAQAREAQIEASLERVRASAMAMHRSDELSNVLAILFEQFDVLKIQPVDVHLDLFDLEKNTFSYRATGKEGKRVIAEQIVDLDSRPEWKALLEKWKNGRPNTVDFSYYPKEVIRDLMAFFPDIWADMPEDAIMSPEDFPNGIFDALGFCKFGYIGFHHHRKASEEEQKILIRFANEFERLYQRFLDLQKAEAQAREAQIEASLERLRSKTMAMHNSQDVGDTVATMLDELVKLGVETVRCGIAIIDVSKTMEVWTASAKEDGGVRLIIGQLDMKTHPLFMSVYDAWKNKVPVTTYELIGEDLKDYFRAINNSPNYPIRYDIDSLPLRQSNTAFMFPEGSLFVFSQEPLVTETTQIFKRFAGVFGQTYRRYLDLLKAEANAREAQIEAGLERVRAKAMAMHSSKDLAETLSVFYRELKSLSVVPIRCGVALMDKESRMAELTTMNTTGEGDSIEIIGKIKMTGHPVLDGVFESWLVQKEYHAVLRGNQIKEYYQVLKPQIDYLDYSQDEAQFGYYFMFNEGDVYAWTEKELTEDELTIYRRFTTVISLTYKRYKDLQQAEAQAREAKIEAGLERVRSKTMAMHNSDDVTSATATMFTELERLGVENMRCGIAHYLEDHKMEVWSVSNLADGKVVRGAGLLDTNSIPFWKLFYSTWQKKEDFLYYYMAGKEKEDYFKKINAVQNYLSQSIEELPDLSIQAYYFPEGSVWAFSLKPHSEDDKQVMKRFASVFSLTFRRYQDLQKAEAQTREATIETALEKVRGKAMAMHNSNDLTATASLVFTELRKLGINPMRCGVGMLNKENRKGLLYTAIASEEGDSLSQIGWVLLDVHPVLRSVYDHWMRGEDYFPVLKEEVLRSFYEQLKSGFVVPEEQTKYEHHGYFLPFSEGVFYGWSEKPFTELEIKVLKRFASVIDLTFRRYIELQKSEANAREAVKQAALDRVRAEIASMRTINDLDRITPLIWNELTILGIPFIRCGVFIMDNEQQLIHTFLSTPDGKAIAAFHLPYDTPGNLRHVVTNWKKNKKYIDHWDETEFIQFADILVKGGALVSAEQYLKTIPKGGFYLHFLPFLQGMLYVGNTTQLKEEEIELIQHVADAFSTAYARYEDFNKLESAKQQVEKTLTDLKQAQTQLVQSEKMASLGEMTAGIAHEIQNPLNFVNNFSEVSKELLDEMKTELETGNTEDAKDIADDVIQNLEKINHHGKRADAIVKSMLQHSRSSSGKKEPADINGLADEYLRLAYHGLRAKDKSFNAKFETEFDNNIGKINIISQDIGRVLVNLINNAFYAVSERKKQESNGYEPTVTVHTKKMDDKIEIKVSDNGNGIPKKVLDKIFQPFFTTKPTGQGTGLGLSLAYDIVTKGHGGELKVETKEGEGSEFIIQLPNQS